MKERNDEPFDLEDEFLGESSSEQDGDLDRLIVIERRPKGQRRPAQQSAWSRVEDARRAASETRAFRSTWIGRGLSQLPAKTRC
jgi:hypothetical protein